MNDWETKDIVAWILQKMGLITMMKDALNGNNIDLYIKYIKHKSKHYHDINDLIHHFL